MTGYALLVVLAATLSMLATSVRVHRFSRTHLTVRARPGTARRGGAARRRA